MGNRIQNQVANVSREEQAKKKIEEARIRLIELEKDAHHKYIKVSNGLSKLTLLCKTDDEGNLVPSEIKRINRLKKILGIK